jgi:acetyl-CoA C-acetyltransferase
MAEAFIVSAVRTAGGKRGGRLSGWHPADLAGRVLDALVDQVGADPALIEDVIMGCVSQVGQQSSNVARWAVLSSKLPEEVPATTIDRQCGSSQQAIHFAAQAVMSGTMDVVIAGGVESMTRVPMGTAYMLPYREGLGLPSGEEISRRYPGHSFSQFVGAELLGEKYGLNRDELEAYALRSHQRAAAATTRGDFDAEILPIEVTGADGATELHHIDEGVRFDASLEQIRALKLLPDAKMLTPATSSQMCDGASGVMIVNERGLKKLGVEPLARIHHMTVVGCDPVIIFEGPIFGARKALEKTGMSIDDIGMFEVNEAFATMPLSFQKAIGVNPERLNMFGGGLSLGHPLGATGTKLMATLVHGLKRHNQRYGMEAICEGAGQANVTIVERL